MEILFGLAALFGAVGASVLIIVVSMMWRGFVLSVLWKWFMVPLLGLPALGLIPAMAVALVVGFMVYQYHYTVDERSSTEKLTAGLAHIIMMPAWVLLVGWVLTLFI